MYGRVTRRSSFFAATMAAPIPARWDAMTGSAAVSQPSLSCSRCSSSSSWNVGALSASSTSIWVMRRTSSSE